MANFDYVLFIFTLAYDNFVFISKNEDTAKH